eukprot:TRINITY_DN4985_c0_g1_i1.p1 TRINITY_DN4985_c0_g1~~TRINITY_DN4985_c0_g1_i1.p1  ORF type:complete len:505 (-),score=137.25 TRINITY_DN4985_c0_g1_i1:29-1495(-)
MDPFESDNEEEVRLNNDEEEDEIIEQVDSNNNNKKKRKTQLPKRGVKDFDFVGSGDQIERIEAARKKWKEALDTPKQHKKSTLSKGLYHPNEHRVEIIAIKGKHFSTMGHSENGKMYLSLEEALFFIDQGLIEIYPSNEGYDLNGLPLSLQEIMKALLESGFSLEEYIVFSLLRRLGYILIRFNNNNNNAQQIPTITPTTSTTQTTETTLYEQNPIQPKTIATSFPRADILSQFSPNANITSNISNLIPSFSFDSLQNQITFIEYNDNNRSSNNNNNNNNSEGTQISFLKSRSWFPSDSDESDDENINTHNNFFPHDNSSINHIKYIGEYNKPIFPPPPKPRIHEKLNILPIQDDSEVIQPLMRVSEFEKTPKGEYYNKSVKLKADDLLATLQQTPCISLNYRIAKQPASNAKSSKVNIHFNVYKPDSGFTKKKPGLPSFTLCVSRYNEALSLSDLRHLNSLSSPIPLQFAIVSGGDVTFFGFQDKPS